MNRTQKNAWFGLVNCLLAIGFTIFLYYRIVFWIPVPGFKFAPEPSQTQIIFQAIGNFWPLVMPVIAVILLLIPRTKQSPAEPDFDELDADIQNKAIRRSFFYVWFLWPMALMLTALKNENTGILSVWEGLFIHFLIFLVCMTIYFLTTVILYHKQTAGGAV